MPAEKDRLREAIQRTLEVHTADPRDARAVAGATLGTWQQVSERLTPVIGERGVDALFTRALHLASATFPWLADGDGPASAATFKARLEAHEARAAAAASQAVLLAFTNLLATLIGNPLSERLLASVWAPNPSPEPEP